MAEWLWTLLVYWGFLLGAMPWAFLFNCCCGCTTCNHAEQMNWDLEVTFSGITNQTCTGSDCPNLNTIWLFPASASGTLTQCSFNYGNTTLCGSSVWELTGFVRWNTPNTEILVRVNLFGSGEMVWFYTNSGRANCSDLSSIDVPVLSDSNTRCNNSGSTCTATLVV